MSILLDLSTTRYNSIKTMDEFNEEYKKSNHLYRLIEFIVLSFLNAKFAETPINRRGPINIIPYTLEFIFNADYTFNWTMDEYFTYKLSKCKPYVKSFLKHKTADLTIEQNMTLFLNLQTLTPRNTNPRVWLSEVDPYLEKFRLFAFNIKYNNLGEFLFHMSTNMFVSEYNTMSTMSVKCKEQTSGSVLANGNIGCFVVALWAAGLIDTDMYLYILQGFEYIFSNSGTNNDAIMYAMNIFLTQTLIRLYKNRKTTIKVYAIPYMFDSRKSVLTNTLNMIVYEIETRVKELLEQLEISSRNLFHTNADGSIGDIKIPLITLIRYTPTSHGFGHTFNLIIEGNSLDPKISIADFYENKAITVGCEDGTLKYKNVLLQRQYSANMSSDFVYSYRGKDYPNVLPIASLNPFSIMSILLIQQHDKDDGYFQLFCEVTTDIKDGQPNFNIDPRFLLNNDKSVTKAKKFISRIKKIQKTKKRTVKKFVNTIKKRLGKPLVAISESSSSRSSSSTESVTSMRNNISKKLAQQFAVAVFSNAKKSDFETIMDNPNFNCNLSLDDIDPALIPPSLHNSKLFAKQIKNCIDQKNTPLLILVGRKFTETVIEMIIKLLDMNCVNINYINVKGDNVLTILLEMTNAILEELDNEDEDGYDEEYKTILRKEYENHIFLALRLITEGVDVNYGNGTTPLEYAIKFKSKLLLEELLSKGVTPSSMRQSEMINRILYTTSSSSRESSKRSETTPSDLSSISFSSLDLLDRGTPPPPLERITGEKDVLVDITPFNIRPPTPLTPQSRKLSRKNSKKSTGSLPSLDLDDIKL